MAVDTRTKRSPVKGEGTGPGRPKGQPNKATKEQVDKAKRGGMLPLDYMLKVMRNSRLRRDVRMDAAKAAAPYIHPRLSSLEVGGEGLKTFTREPMSEDEFISKHGVEAPARPAGRLN